MDKIEITEKVLEYATDRQRVIIDYLEANDWDESNATYGIGIGPSKVRVAMAGIVKRIERDSARDNAPTTMAGEIVRNIRKREGITQAEMSELFGFGINQMYLWESGRTRACFGDVLMIVEYYNTDITSEIDHINANR